MKRPGRETNEVLGRSGNMKEVEAEWEEEKTWEEQERDEGMRRGESRAGTPTVKLIRTGEGVTFIVIIFNKSSFP